MSDIDADFIRGYFEYDKTIGRLIRNGLIIGCETKRGYRQIQLKGKSYREHRLIWLHVYGEWPENEIDHINHIRNDNRIENLRDVTRIENGKNQSMHSDNDSGVTGVSWHPHRNKWGAHICHDGKRINLGRFINKNDAIEARLGAEKTYKYHVNHG